MNYLFYSLKRILIHALYGVLLMVLSPSCTSGDNTSPADKPLFRDPVYDGAADPVVVWNDLLNKHVMYYTNRRATVVDEEGVSWVHGTRIGMAVSDDGGRSWEYLDTCNIAYRPDPQPTYWAPDVICHKGLFHMFLTYVPGIFADWNHPRYIVHLSSENGMDWDFQSRLSLASEKVLDASVLKLPGGGWRLWYNNEGDKKTMYYADSEDLYHWTDKGKAHGIQRGEGAKVFSWKGKFFMFTDEWKGLGVYSSEDLLTWKKQEGNLLAKPGKGTDDQVIGQHCDVVVEGEKAWIFYFTHPGRTDDADPENLIDQQRSTLQVAALIFEEGKIMCERDNPAFIRLSGTK